MLETYFVAPKTLKRLRTGPSEPYIDGFAAALEQDQYSQGIAVRYLRAAAHLGHFVQQRGGTLADLDPTTLVAFRRHLTSCRCPQSNSGRIKHHMYFGAKRFYRYLLERGICRKPISTFSMTGSSASILSIRAFSALLALLVWVHLRIHGTDM